MSDWFEMTYKNYHIHIEPKDMTDMSCLRLVLQSIKYNYGVVIDRKTNKEITYCKTIHSSFFNSKEEKKVFNTYNSKETLDELVEEAKIIVDYLEIMEEKIEREVRNRSGVLEPWRSFEK